MIHYILYEIIQEYNGKYTNLVLILPNSLELSYDWLKISIGFLIKMIITNLIYGSFYLIGLFGVSGLLGWTISISSNLTFFVNVFYALVYIFYYHMRI